MLPTFHFKTKSNDCTFLNSSLTAINIDIAEGISPTSDPNIVINVDKLNIYVYAHTHAIYVHIRVEHVSLSSGQFKPLVKPPPVN